MALRDQPYIPLYVQDFLTDEKLSECSAESTGVYIRLMCIMHKSQVYGTISLKQKDKQNPKQNGKQISDFALKLVRQMPYDAETIERALTELLEEGVLTLDGDIIFQKRMVRDGKLSDARASAGRRGGKISKTQSNDENFASGFAQAKTQANTENEIESENENENVIESEGDIEDSTSRAKKKKTVKKAVAFSPEDKAFKAAAYLDDCIRKRLPDQKPADDHRLQSWADAFDKCHRLDGQEWDTVARVLRFSQEDQFWQQNILSGTKFREKFVQLLSKMQAQGEPYRKPSASASAMNDLQTLHAMFSEEDNQ